jgi:hypothetical protein
MSHASGMNAETTKTCSSRIGSSPDATLPAAVSAVPTLGPVPGEVASICEAIGLVFPDWQVWWHTNTYYARRMGRWLETPGAGGAYAVWDASPAVLVLMLDAQDRVQRHGRRDAPARSEPPSP